MISIFRRYKNNLLSRGFISDSKVLGKPEEVTCALEKVTMDMRGIGLAVYGFEKALNQFVYQVGFTFKATSQGLRKCLHTGYWQRYAMVIFFSLILSILVSLCAWIV
jgi:hypothetical protein